MLLQIYTLWYFKQIMNINTTMYCNHNTVTILTPLCLCCVSVQRVPGLLQWVQLDRLRAGHEYRVWLSSSTSLGDGGVISDPLNFTTPEDGQSPHTDRAGEQLCTVFPTVFTSFLKKKKITPKHQDMLGLSQNGENNK